MTVEPRVLLGRELLGARRTPWRVALVEGDVVRPEAHGFPELKGLTLTAPSFPDRPLFPMKVTIARGSAVHHAGIDVFRVGVRQFQVFTFRSTFGRPSRALSPAALAAISAVRAADATAKRLVLADVLAEEGAIAEAEYLQKELALVTRYDARGADVLAELRDFVALASEVGATFRYLVGRDVDGCTGPRWTFRCPRSQQDLLPTDDATLAFCERCATPVTLAASEAEAARLASTGVCVSFHPSRWKPVP